MTAVEYIRNQFGLGDCTLKNLLWNLLWMMKMLTINFDSSNHYYSLKFVAIGFTKAPSTAVEIFYSAHGASIFIYAFNFICLVSFFYVYVLSFLYNWICIYPIKKDHIGIIVIASLSFAAYISIMKLAYMFIMRKKLMEIIDVYRNIDLTIDVGSRYGRSMLQALKAVKKRSLIFWTSFVGASIVYLITPLISPGKNLPENKLILIGMEPMIESPNYEISYLSIVLAGFTATMVPANITVLLIILLGYIEAHIIALTEEFRFLWQDALENVKFLEISAIHRRSVFNTDNELNVIVKERLVFLVSRHSECVTLMQKICKLFEGAIAFEFVLTVIALCTVLLGGVENTFLQIPYTIIQLVVDSLIGQRLLDAALVFGGSIYECGWENFNASNMRIIQVVLQCSQRPLNLKAGGITTLCFESFMSITKSVYSAYATLSKTIK